jgi:hypothetical protein
VAARLQCQKYNLGMSSVPLISIIMGNKVAKTASCVQNCIWASISTFRTTMVLLPGYGLRTPAAFFLVWRRLRPSRGKYKTEFAWTVSSAVSS